MPGNTLLIHSPGADPTYRTHWWNCYFSSCYKSSLSFMSVKWNAENMWHVSPLSSLISHSSLDAFLKDHRNVYFKTCLVNFLDPEAYTLNLSNFLFSVVLWNSFLFLLGSNNFQIKTAATAHSILWCRLWVEAFGTSALTGWNYMCLQGNCPRGVPGTASNACSAIQYPEFLRLRHSTGTLLPSRQRAERHTPP